MTFGGSAVAEKHMVSVVDRIMASNDVHTIIPVTCVYMAWPGKRDSAHETKGPGLEIGRLSWIIWEGKNLIMST